MNKGELRSHFLALLNRSDCTDALADTFIEQSIARMQRTLRIPPMERQFVYQITTVTDKILLPADFLEAIEVYYGGNALTRVPVRQILEMRKDNYGGGPRFFAREQGTLLLHPSPSSGDIYLNYYGEFEELVNDTDENTASLVASDLIVYGALSYASDYFLDDRGQMFEQKFVNFLSELQIQADEAEVTGTVQGIVPMVRYED